MSKTTLEEKDKYITDHLVKLKPDTLRYIVADLAAEVERLTALVEEAPKFFSLQYDFEGEKLEWLKRAEVTP